MNQNKHVPYGIYDCLMNAIIYWMLNKGHDPQKLFRYNWDFYYDKRYDLFGGSLSKDCLINFLRAEYSLQVIDLEFSDITNDKCIFIALDTYDLSYIPDFYQKVNQLHYVLAIKHQNQIGIFDPYYNVNQMLSIDECIEAWGKFQKSILTIEDLKPKKITHNRQIYPYMAEIDYEERFFDAFKDIQVRLEEFQSNTYRLSEDYNYKKYFGCLRAVYLNRKKYFDCIEVQGNIQTDIVDSWENVLREYVKVSILGVSHFKNVIITLEKALLREISYLSNLI